MYDNNYILNLLNIKDKNIFILKNELKSIKKNGRNNQIIEGILTYNPEYCPKCGCINDDKQKIIKWGFRKNCKVIIPNVSLKNTILLLHKQRFLCTCCNKTFVASTTLVDKNKNISNNSILQITTELMRKQSEKDIAKKCNVSVSVVDKVLNKISKKTILRHDWLPTEMCWDEFKATNDTVSKMAFMIVNYKTGNIFDIRNSRLLLDLESYFKMYSRSERNKVRLISTDFYPTYINTAKKLFKNADIVIDRFHIITQVYVALNMTRVKFCKK